MILSYILSFLVKIIGSPKVKTSPEHQDFAWIKESEINNYELTDEIREVIKKAFKLVTYINLNEK